MPPECQLCCFKTYQTIQTSHCLHQGFLCPGHFSSFLCSFSWCSCCLWSVYIITSAFIGDLRVSLDVNFLQHLSPLILQHPVGCLAEVYCYTTFLTKAQRSEPWSCQPSETLLCTERETYKWCHHGLTCELCKSFLRILLYHNLSHFKIA